MTFHQFLLDINVYFLLFTHYIFCLQWYHLFVCLFFLLLPTWRVSHTPSLTRFNTNVPQGCIFNFFFPFSLHIAKWFSMGKMRPSRDIRQYLEITFMITIWSLLLISHGWMPGMCLAIL